MVGLDDIPYSRIRVIYVLRPCAVGFALRNVRDIFLRKWLLVVFNISVACHDQGRCQTSSDGRAHRFYNIAIVIYWYTGSYVHLLSCCLHENA